MLVEIDVGGDGEEGGAAGGGGVAVLFYFLLVVVFVLDPRVGRWLIVVFVLHYCS